MTYIELRRLLMPKLLIWGTGGHAAVVKDVWTRLKFASQWIDDNDPRVKDDTWIDLFPPKEYLAFVGVGDNKTREKITAKLKQKGYHFPAIISPQAYVAHRSCVSSGSFVGPMAVVHTRAIVGEGAIINTGATVDHDCNIGSFVHIAPGVHLCGNVSVGAGTLVGVGTSVIPDVSIGSDIIIAGGSSVNEDLLTKKSLYAGNPARYKRGPYDV